MYALVVKVELPRILYMQVLIIRVLVTVSTTTVHVLVKVCVHADKNGCVDNDNLADNNTFADDNEILAEQPCTCK